MNTQTHSRRPSSPALPIRPATQLLIGWTVITAGMLLIAADWLHTLV